VAQKRCSKCGKLKPLTAFYKNKRNKDGLNSLCRECCKELYKKNKEKKLNYYRNYYKKHKEEKLNYAKNYKKNNRERISRYRREYYEKNREREKQRQREYYRKHKEEIIAKQRIRVIGSGGRYFRKLNKRNWTGYCELCGRSNIKQLSYHHWDDKNPSKGIWICNSCHMMVTAYENGKFAYLQKYLRLKRFLNRQYRLRENLKPEQN